MCMYDLQQHIKNDTDSTDVIENDYRMVFCYCGYAGSYELNKIKVLIQGGPDITCQKNSGSLEGSNKSKKPHFVRSKIMGIN
jgi:hypothetical protein